MIIPTVKVPAFRRLPVEFVKAGEMHISKRPIVLDCAGKAGGLMIRPFALASTVVAFTR